MEIFSNFIFIFQTSDHCDQVHQEGRRHLSHLSGQIFCFLDLDF